MSYNSQRKILNIYLLLDLLKLKKKRPVDGKKILKKQNKRIKKLVKKAFKIPFYREKFETGGVLPSDIKCADDLRKLPLLEKSELKEWMEEEQNKEKNKDCYKYVTSGSTGTPLSVLYSPKEKAYNMANWLRVMFLAGHNPFYKKTMMRADINSDVNKKNILQKLGILKQEYINQFQEEKEIINKINKYKPDFLYLNKSELVRICIYAEENNIDIYHPKAYAPISEMIDEPARRLFKKTLGPGIIDAYGTNEVGSLMVRFFDDKSYEINNDIFVVNIYEDDMKNTGRLVITPLYKTDFPIINYDIGDAVLFDSDNKSEITKIIGRVFDGIKHRSGKVTSPYEIMYITDLIDELTQIRFIQKSYDELVIQCVLDEKTASKKGLQKSDIEEKIRNNLSNVLKDKMIIKFEWLSVIQPDENGKIKLIDSCI